ncbi:MAG: ParB/RepB/Spo0J family partition protein [Phycisphaerae bacterium]|nr:ParB/RepB/Spo0J family partition protein [Phycisphaerae bacterium]
MKKKRRLGRGLDSLLSATSEDSGDVEDAVATGDKSADEGTGGGQSAKGRAKRGESDAATSRNAAGAARPRRAAPRARDGDTPMPTNSSTFMMPTINMAQDAAAGVGPPAHFGDRLTTQGGGATGGRGDGAKAMQVRMLSVALLSPNPHQPRSRISDESVAKLADSIRETGILQPITVRVRGGRYQVVTGERRWRAAELANLHEVPVVVREVDDEEMLEMALIENIQREDLNAMDRAMAYQQYCGGFSKTPEDVGRRLGEDRSTVVNFLRLLELPEEVKELVAKGLLSAGHGRSLLGLGDPVKMGLLARSIVKQGLSVRAVEEIVRRSKGKSPKEAGPAAVGQREKSAHMRDLENRFSMSCGTKVVIQEGQRKSQGKILIEYYSLDDFERIAQRLGVTVEDL